jgi:hypothetical protein
MRLEQIWIQAEHPLSIFKIKIIICMILESKHKQFKDQYNNKERVQNLFNIRPQMSILMVFEWYYFQAILNWWHSPLNFSPRKIFSPTSPEKYSSPSWQTNIHCSQKLFPCYFLPFCILFSLLINIVLYLSSFFLFLPISSKYSLFIFNPFSNFIPPSKSTVILPPERGVFLTPENMVHPCALMKQWR